MASPNVHLFTTDTPSGARSVIYKGFVIVNKTKSRNAFSDIGSGFKSLVGGELKGLSKLTRDLRNELIFEAMQQATTMGANAITGIRIETSNVFEGVLDVVLYGTAVYYN